MREGNIVAEKSMEFAVRIIKLYSYLCEEKREHVMSKQLLRSGTSVGANVKEAIYAQSRKDFASKMSIGLKEASETEYWLELLNKTGYLTNEQYQSLQSDCGELAKMLIAIVRSTKANCSLLRDIC